MKNDDKGEEGTRTLTDDAGIARDKQAAAPSASPSSVSSETGTGSPLLYEIQGEHARGGLGRVLRARDVRLDRTMAIKELLNAGGQSSVRFEREARLTAKLQHPAIVPIHEAGHWPDGRPFYTMKLVEGTPLRDLIAKKSTLAERLSLLPTMIAVSEAIAYAHGMGIIHRDLKPSNVIVGTFGETVVIDWGLAKEVHERESAEPAGPYRSAVDDHLTSVGAIVGTPAYMPPEQAAGQVADERSDVYALGAMLFHLLDGKPPFTGTSSAAILKQVIEGPSPAARLRQKGVANDLIAIVDKAMAHDPVKRYATAAELCDDLKRFQTGQLVAVHDYSWRQLIAKWIQNHRAASISAVLFVVAFAIVGSIALSRIIKEKNTATAARRLADQRASDLIVGRAQAAMEADPTEAVAWLKTYLRTGGNWERARDLAADAESRGVALVELSGHSDSVFGTRFVDNHSLVSVAQEGTLRSWDLSTGEGRVVERIWPGSSLWPVFQDKYAYLVPGGGLVVTEGIGGLQTVLPGHVGRVEVEASHEGPVLTTLDQESTLRIWDLMNAGAPLLAKHEGVQQSAFSNDGSIMLYAIESGGNLELHVLRIATNRDELLSALPETYVRDLALSADGAFAIIGYAGGVVEIVSTQTSLRWVVANHGGLALVVASPDGLHFASSGDDGLVKIWEVDGTVSLEPIAEFRHAGKVTRLGFSNTGRFLSWGGDDGVLGLFGMASGRTWRLSHGESLSADVAFSPDDSLLATGGNDRNKIRVWRVPEDDGRVLQSGDSALFHVAYMPDGKSIAAEGRLGTAFVWDLGKSTRRAFGGLDEIAFGLTVSASGRHLAVTALDGTTVIWNTITGAFVPLANDQNRALDLSFSPDGKLLATAGADGSVELWKTSGELLCRWPGPGPSMRSVRFPDDGQFLVAAGHDGLLWKLSVSADCGVAPKSFRGPRTKGISTMSLSADGRFAATGASDNSVTLWDTSTGTTFEVFRHSARIWRVALSRDARFVASTGEDGVIFALDRESGRRIELELGSQFATHLEFAPVGDLLAIAVQDGSTRLWSPSSGSLCVLRGHANYAVGVAFRPDGNEVASVGWDGTLRTWPLPSRCPRRSWSLLRYLEDISRVDAANIEREILAR